jgi:vacuolar protein sorting-associated protein IST1
MKPQLKMAVQRINLVKNKKTNKIKASKREIAQLLADEKEEKGRIRSEALIREDFIIEAYEIIELLCELCAERIALISTEKECPFDMHEAVCTLIWAANKTEVSELMEVKKQFTYKYGKQFTERAMKNHDGCVNERVLHKLSVQPPNAYLVVNYMSEIAKQFSVEWEPAVEPSFDSMDPMSAPSGFSVPIAPGSTFSQVYDRPGEMMATTEQALPQVPHTAVPAAPVPTAQQQMLEQQNSQQQQQLMAQQMQMQQMQQQMAQMAQMQQQQQMQQHIQQLPVVNMSQQHATHVPLSGGGYATVNPSMPAQTNGQLGMDIPVAGVPVGSIMDATLRPAPPEVMTSQAPPEVMTSEIQLPMTSSTDIGAGQGMPMTSAGANDLESRLKELQQQSGEVSQGLDTQSQDLHARLESLNAPTHQQPAMPPAAPGAAPSADQSGGVDPMQTLNDLPLPPGVSPDAGAGAPDADSSGGDANFDDLAARFARLHDT